MKLKKSLLITLIGVAAAASALAWTVSQVRRATARAEATLSKLAVDAPNSGRAAKADENSQLRSRIEHGETAAVRGGDEETAEVFVQVSAESQGLPESLARQYKDAYVFTGEVHQGVSTATGRHTTEAEMTAKEEILLRNNPELRDSVEADRVERRAYAKANGY